MGAISEQKLHYNRNNLENELNYFRGRRLRSRATERLRPLDHRGQSYT